MVVHVYISGISGNKDVKKRQQRVTMILESKNIEYSVIDITEPGKENEKEFMQENSKARDSKHPLPPQIFSDGHYCGDYEAFDMANELDELEKFLRISDNDSNNAVYENEITNGSKDIKDLFKNNIRESEEEPIDTLKRIDSKTVSISNENETKVPNKNHPCVPGESHANTLENHFSIPDENDSGLSDKNLSVPDKNNSDPPDENHSSIPDETSNTIDEITKSEVNLESEPVEYGSLDIKDSEKTDEKSSNNSDED